ncbi:hypothetical protein NEOLEDRAFT_1142988 [Neolentinus lepideus HHB14362 ss-1]|uniref:Uncharacterized protein n=1 Tax=Neolentinus lepideus HHB14362 ss-1 TaxID=1314782 RepID=A0A165MT69_9AGAM|nr:hypothetical protein NEOLEDRAFT_1142988 [Neolentinus lepideus HHB14362 ss-1]
MLNNSKDYSGRDASRCERATGDLQNPSRRDEDKRSSARRDTAPPKHDLVDKQEQRHIISVKPTSGQGRSKEWTESKVGG